MSYTAEQQAEARALWVEALRSGEYTQARGMLHRLYAAEADDSPAGHCCLGVACEVAIQHGVIDYYIPDAGDLTGDCQPVADWLGINEGGFLSVTPPGTTASNLIDLNDADRWTFDQIADLIEAGGVLVVEGEAA